MMKLKRRQLVRIISIGMMALIIAIGFAINQFFVANALRRQIKAGYQRSIYELNGYISQIGMNLEKNLVSTSPNQIMQLSSEIWRLSGAAKSSLSQLPLSKYNIEQLHKYLSQVGDYVYSLSRKVVGGQTITDEEYSNIEKLYQYTQKLSQELDNISFDYFNNHLDFNETVSPYKTLLDYTMDKKLPDLAENLSTMVDGIDGYPGLVYDGLFSDHIEKMPPVFLEGAAEVTRDDARKVAASFFDVDPSELKDDGECTGKIPCYRFILQDNSIGVTKKGGYVLEMLGHQEGSDHNITVEDAINTSKNLIAKLGFKNMVPTYYNITGATVLINFVYAYDDILCYNDLIQTEICLATGEVCGFNSTGYISNHMDRRPFLTKNINIDALSSKISKNLKPICSRLAIIPNDAKREILTVEVTAENGNGNKFLVYINASTGEEEKIKMLSETESGQMTI